MKCEKCNSENVIRSLNIPTFKCLDCGHVTLDRDFIIDEMCSCGHKRSEHLPRTIVALSVTGLSGHGACTKCNCRKFTWVSWIFKES